jgi:uncharacterized delta-60 repeat protein
MVLVTILFLLIATSSSQTTPQLATQNAGSREGGIIGKNAPATGGYWAKTYGGERDEYAHSVKQTSDGGYVIAGQADSFNSTLEDETDFWILKLDSGGSVDWQKAYGSNKSGYYGGSYAYSVGQTSDGGFIVAGYTDAFGAGGGDFWVLRLRSNGSVIWQRTYGGTGYDGAYGVQETSDGGFIVAGTTTSFGVGGYDFWVLKLNSTGGVAWQKTYGGSGNDYASSVQETSDGGFIVVGRTNSFGVGGYDFWVLKLDSTGSVSWQNAYGGSGNDYAYSVEQTFDGGYAIAGSESFAGNGSVYVWIVKLDPSGSVVWQKTYRDSGWDEAYSIQQPPDGGYVVAGYTSSHEFDMALDFWVLRLDPTGGVIWQKAYGGQGMDYGRSIEVTSDGSFVVAGDVHSFGAGGQDLWVIKLDADGGISWDAGSGAATRITTAVASDPGKTASTTSATPMDSSATIESTHVVPRDTNASITVQTHGGGGVPMALMFIIAGVVALLLLASLLYARQRRGSSRVSTRKVGKAKREEEKPVEEELKGTADLKRRSREGEKSARREELPEAEETPIVAHQPMSKASLSVLGAVSETPRPVVIPSGVAAPQKLAAGRVFVMRGGEVVGDEYVFKVKVMNDTPYNITNATVTLAAYPTDCLTGASGFSEVRRVSVIEAGGFASPTFELAPTKDCVKGSIKAVVSYVDFRNKLQMVEVEPHEIAMVCGLLKPFVVDEKEFEESIKDWVKTDGNVEVRGMNAQDVFKRASDLLRENNFYVVASQVVPGERVFAGVMKGYAQGKYSGKRVGVTLEIRGDIHGEDSSIKVITSTEDKAMLAPAIHEVLTGLRKPRLFGKKAYYEKLGGQVLKIADEMSSEKGSIVSLADLCLEVKRREGATKTPVDSIEEAVNTLCEKGLIGGTRRLASGIKIIEVKPIELSKDLGKILDSVSSTGVTTAAELIRRTKMSKEVAETALERLERSGVAKRVIEQGNVEKWYFPAFYKPEEKGRK